MTPKRDRRLTVEEAIAGLRRFRRGRRRLQGITLRDLIDDMRRR